MTPGMRRLLNASPPSQAPDFYTLRSRCTRDLECAEAELEILEEVIADAPEAVRAHLTLALEKVRQALTTTLVMNIGNRKRREDA